MLCLILVLDFWIVFVYATLICVAVELAMFLNRDIFDFAIFCDIFDRDILMMNQLMTSKNTVWHFSTQIEY